MVDVLTETFCSDRYYYVGVPPSLNGISPFGIAFLLFIIVWKVSRYKYFYGPYFSVFGLNISTEYISVLSPNAGKYGPEKSLYLDIFHAVYIINFPFHVLNSKTFKRKYFWIFKRTSFSQNCRIIFVFFHCL